MHPEDIAEAISTLKNDGKIINFGVSNFTPSQVNLIADHIAVDVNQIEFSLTQNSAMTNGTLDQMLQKKMQPMSWSPLGSVFREETHQTKSIKEVLKRFSTKYNCTEDALLLAWLFKHPAKVAPVIGTTNKDRILNANKALEINLELEDWFIMLEASNGQEVA